MNNPLLVDYTIRNALKNELKKSEVVNNIYNSLILNISLLIILFLGLGIILYIKYKEKNNENNCDDVKKSRLLNKISNMKYDLDINKEYESKKKGLITNLPVFSTIL